MNNDKSYTEHMGKVISSFDSIALFEDRWEHIKLASAAKRVTGIDVSPNMISEAEKRNPNENISYLVMDLFGMPDEARFDCIVSIAALHHMYQASAVTKIKKMLRPGGVFIALDLYKRTGAYDLMLDIIAFPANIFLSVLKNGIVRKNSCEKKAWEEHAVLDRYLTMDATRDAFSKDTDGSLAIRRLLFWRCLAVYRKPLL